jgi:hypothetical protein
MADILAAIAILVAILSTLFGLVYPDIQKIMAITPSTGLSKANNQAAYVEATRIGRTKVVPLLLGCILLTLVFLPECWHELVNAWKVWRSKGKIDMETYDTASAAYIVTTFFAISLTIAVTITFAKFFGKVRELRWK